jgi:isopenicillin N synthase-like dioxygenase
MSSEKLELPVIDFAPYLDPKSPGDQEKVIAQVRDACQEYGFFQVKGHGIPVGLQHQLLSSLNRLFSMPREEKMKLSYLENKCRRGYEASGMSMRPGDAMPDSKEVSTLNSYSRHLH